MNIQVSDEDSPLEILQKEEAKNELQAALERLSPMEKEIIVLRHYSQMSFKELAEHYNIPVGTALSQVHRGLKKLKRILQDNESPK